MTRCTAFRPDVLDFLTRCEGPSGALTGRHRSGNHFAALWSYQDVRKGSNFTLSAQNKN